MPKNNKHTPQAQRIIDFVELTGLTQTQFSIQCGFKSPSTMQTICTDGQSPTTKTLSKIVHRFPQLNYDWVLMGIGEMINKAFAKAPSSKSSQRSTRATFDQIQKNQSVNDLKTNELKSDVADLMKLMKDTMILTAQQNGMLTIKIEEQSVAIKEAREKSEETYKKRDVSFQKAKAEHIALIDKYNNQREKTMKSEFFTLSDKVRCYLEESRGLMIKNLDENSITRSDRVNKRLEKFEETTIKHINKSRELVNEDYKTAHEKSIQSMLKVGLKATTEATELLVKNMDKNAVKQTDIAIKQFVSYFSPKALLSKIGSHSVNKKP